MNANIHVPDPLRAAVEKATEGECTVHYSKKGIPCYASIVPAFRCEDVSPDLGEGLHPAFCSNGKEYAELHVFTYPASGESGAVASLPYQPPRTFVTKAQAQNLCAKVGGGFHLMTNWEWAAVALTCVRDGHLPRGNNNMGRSAEADNEKGFSHIPAANKDIILTGSGPVSWRHNGRIGGIADLAGNVWEWVDGLIQREGGICMPPVNDVSSPEDGWPRVAYVYSGPGALFGGTPPSAPLPDFWASTPFSGDVGCDERVDMVALRRAALLPCSSFLRLAAEPFNAPIGRIWMAAASRDFLVAGRGGHFSNTGDAGVFALSLTNAPSDSGYLIGFRACKLL